MKYSRSLVKYSATAPNCSSSLHRVSSRSDQRRFTSFNAACRLPLGSTNSFSVKLRRHSKWSLTSLVLSTMFEDSTSRMAMKAATRTLSQHEHSLNTNTLTTRTFSQHEHSLNTNTLSTRTLSPFVTFI